MDVTNIVFIFKLFNIVSRFTKIALLADKNADESYQKQNTITLPCIPCLKCAKTVPIKIAVHNRNCARLICNSFFIKQFT